MSMQNLIIKFPNNSPSEDASNLPLPLLIGYFILTKRKKNGSHIMSNRIHAANILFSAIVFYLIFLKK